MKYKIKKYVKFFLSISLICSLMSCSYAAFNNASDGSGFVTKAEFDSALADFNSRLTTFESGINSKIDSQVSSYLDKNGIWSASQQDISTYKDFRNHKWRHPMYWRQPWRDGIHKSANWADDKNVQIKIKGDTDGNFLLFHDKLFTSKKSGLLILNWGWDTIDKGTKAKPMKSGRMYVGNGGTKMMKMCAYLGVGEADKTIVTPFQGDVAGVTKMIDDERLSMVLCDQAETMTNRTLHLFFGLEQEYLSMFFINKDEDIYLDIIAEIYKGSTDANFSVDTNWNVFSSTACPTTDAERQQYADEVDTGIFINTAEVY